MGAYNWIIIGNNCPACHQLVKLDAQTHVASSYDGDATGRFHEGRYRLGEPMRWWPTGHKEYSQWRVNGKVDGPTEGHEDWECCYATCPLCHAELFALIRFQGQCAVEVEQIGLESEWPEEYSR